MARDKAPVAGEIYSFRTSPLSGFAPPETGRYAAFKVLGVNERFVAIAVLGGIWSTPPSLRVANEAVVLHEHRFAHTGRMAVFGVNADWWAPSDLDSVSLLGSGRLSPEEQAIGAKIIGFGIGFSYSTLRFANHAAEGEWRWEHDRDALLVESEKSKAKAAAERAAKEERYRARLKNLTWEKLLAETPFERWAPSPPFPPVEFTKAARETVHSACRELRELGPRPPKAKVRSILRRCVEWFNEADKAAGEVIETEEREDIYAVLEEMAFVAKQKSLVDEIDTWREW
ncbi:hypothetical protein CVM73_10525 [Bradyrhizobium forestalis]|uniref:Uncharacterized protein n=1 Tax=Bradyrhizobium forestalis TaxID=1419263 RepID=A0A2M8RCD3_9BRAD|nr:hypothetical protein [Bradyrhizobium forestalis]PJG55472.1 hypothetical protein CVM73_10525 [Bradyrhizobium forestalis]